MLANIFFGLLIGTIGVGVIYYSDSLTSFGRVMRAENNLGGTRQLYVLVGFIIVVIGLMALFGLINLSGDPQQIQLN
ncbi:MAG TPA: hypothetical protein PK048_01915 [Candidatus Absconditabacterales bacterium]|nr:hypothetical protein [Candidatus Absconditabacterales bacterium]